jgi:hypothetical protein
MILEEEDDNEARANSAGQSGDTQGLTGEVKELLEDGQAYEAEVIESIEDAPDPDESEVHTHQFPDDDISADYNEQDQPQPE